MKISVSFAEHPEETEDLIVKKKIGTGKFNVYHVYSPSYRSDFALKIYPKNRYGTRQYHKEKLVFHLNHPNVIQTVPIVCHYTNFHAILTEHIKYGDFFEVVTRGSFDNDINDTLIRTYFRQLVEGLEYIHSQGVAHLDLKLENLMLGSDYLLKIIDFDHAQPISDNCITSGGTKGYRAPEVRTGDCKDLVAADIFSAGIILFAFKHNEFLFLENDEADIASYNFYVENKSFYWKLQAQRREKDFYRRGFIEFINGMVHQDVEKRFDFKKIKESEWYKGSVLDAENLKVQMRNRIKDRDLR